MRPAMSASAETSQYDQGHAGFAASVMERARALDPDFLVVPQNGLKLPTNGGRPDSHLVAATDAGGQEDLPYGATANCPRPSRGPRTASRLPRSGGEERRERRVRGLARRRAQRALPPQPGRFVSRRGRVASLSTTHYDLLILDAWCSRTSRSGKRRTAAMTGIPRGRGSSSREGMRSLVQDSTEPPSIESTRTDRSGTRPSGAREDPCGPSCPRSGEGVHRLRSGESDPGASRGSSSQQSRRPRLRRLQEGRW